MPMKWKFYLRTVCAALAVVAATTGCDNNDPDDPNPPPFRMSNLLSA